MVWLSRLLLDPRHRLVWRDINDIHALHRTVMHGFGRVAEGDERILFRLDSRPGELVLLVQSWHRPDWSPLEGLGEYAGYLLPADWLSGGENPAVKMFKLHSVVGQQFAFRLYANPTVRQQGGGQSPSRRVGVPGGETEWLKWLERKGLKGGFEIVSAQVTRAEEARGRARTPGDESVHHVRVWGVQFDGVLRVTDPAGLWETLRSGVGSAKGFGFGLLSLAQAR